MRFLPCPQHTKDSDSDNVWTTHAKIDQNKFTFLQISHLSSSRRVRNLTFYFQFTTPARKLTHRMKFEHAERHEFWKHHNSLLPWAREMPKSYPERHEFWKCHVSLPPWAREMPKRQTQKDTNFSNTIILCYLGPENRQIQPRNTRILHKTALIDPSKNAKESIHFSRISHII